MPLDPVGTSGREEWTMKDHAKGRPRAVVCEVRRISSGAGVPYTHSHGAH